MRNLWKYLAGAIILSCIFAGLAWGQNFILQFTEEDGSPSAWPWQVKFANGNLTVNGDGTISIADQTGAGGGDPVLVNTTAITDVNGVDLTSGDVTVTLNAGVSPDTATFGIAVNAVDDTHIDWGTGANQVDTADIAVATDKNFVTDAELTVIGNTSGTNTGDNTVATSGDSATAFFSSGTIEHEYGGLEADVSAYTGLLAISAGATSEVDALSELEAQIADVTAFVVEGTACSNIEGTGLSITAGTLNAATSSTTVSGIVEIAIASEINTGTDATRAISPDSLAGSYAGTKNVEVILTDNSTAPTVVDGLGDVYLVIPAELDGMNLVTVGAHATTVSSSGLPSFQIHNLSNALDMLSTNITLDVSEKDSETATTPPVINASNDHVNTGDEIRFDCDVVGTGTKGITIRMGFRLP